MKKITAITLLTLSTSAAFSFDLGDIQLWAGAGANRSALVVDWNDGKTNESTAWGFLFDGSATGLDLLAAIDAIDPHLVVETETFSFGTAVKGFGYDADLDGNFTGANDHYKSGFGYPGEEGYWSYYIGGPRTDFPIWGYASAGPSDRPLADGSWDGWSFTPLDSSGETPGVPTAAPVPEPATLAALALGSAALIRRRRR